MIETTRDAADPVVTTPSTRRPAADNGSPAAVRRVTSLDGLRGVAAIIVVIHHAVLTLPATDGALDGPAVPGSTAWWLAYTPLHLLWAGEEAVLIFFVLSGFVLALPATLRAVRWRVYYVKRLVRLYVPVWGSLVVAVILKETTRAAPSAKRSDYVNARSDVSLLEAPTDALLVAGAGLLNGPLWSLQWEVVFSLLLPGYLLLAYRSPTRRHRGMLPLVVVGLLGTIAVGTMLDVGALRFLPMFGIGVLMAFNQDGLVAARNWLDERSRPRLAWGSVATSSVVLLTARWSAAGLPMESRLLEAAASGATFAGACLVVFLALHWRVARAVLERRLIQWLGTVSFSLYVIHEPIVVATAVLLPSPDVAAWAAPVIALPVALVASALFFRLVEAPSLALAKRAGRAIDAPRPARR